MRVELSKNVMKADQGKDFIKVDVILEWKVNPPKGSGIMPFIRPAENVKVALSVPKWKGKWRASGRVQGNQRIFLTTDKNGIATADLLSPHLTHAGIIPVKVETTNSKKKLLETVEVTAVTGDVPEPPPSLGGGGFGGVDDGTLIPVEPTDIPDEVGEPFVPAEEFIRLPEMDFERDVQDVEPSGLAVQDDVGAWGMNTRVAKIVVPEPMVRLAQNVTYREIGAFVKRNGYNQINNSQVQN
jgi:hypothetical protein